MAGLSTITVDLARGEVMLGGRSVRLAAERDDAGGFAGRPLVRFRLDDGAVVRLIGFGERSRMVRDALADASPSPALVTLLRAAGHEGPCTTLSDAVLLAIAGGAEAAPEFDRCAVEASRQQGWSWLSVHDTPAIVVDRAVAAPSGPEPSGGWNRFIFPAAGTQELEALLQEMVASLLTRGTPVVDRPSPIGEADAGLAAVQEPAATPRRQSAPAVGRHLRAAGRHLESAVAETPAPAVDVANDTPLAGAALAQRRVSRPAASERQVVMSRVRLDLVSSPPGHTRPDVSSRGVSIRPAVPPASAPATATSQFAASPWGSQVAAAPSSWPPGAAAVRASRPLDRTAALTATSAQRTTVPLPDMALGTRPAATALARAEAPPPAAAAAFAAPLARALSVDPATRAAAAMATAPAIDLIGELAHALAAECDLRGLDT